MDKYVKLWRDSPAGQAVDLSPKKQQRQAKLFELKKVHRLETSSLCPRPADLLAIKAVLDKSSATADELRQAILRLSCYELPYNLLVETQVGRSVKQLRGHADKEVCQLACKELKRLREVERKCKV